MGLVDLRSPLLGPLPAGRAPLRLQLLLPRSPRIDGILHVCSILLLVFDFHDIMAHRHKRVSVSAATGRSRLAPEKQARTACRRSQQRVRVGSMRAGKGVDGPVGGARGAEVARIRVPRLGGRCHVHVAADADTSSVDEGIV